MAVPYTFANQTGPIPLIELDVNFANVKAFANTAGTVTSSAQPAITSLGALTALHVTGGLQSGSLTTTTGAVNGALTVGGTLSVSGGITVSTLSATTVSATNIIGTLTTGAQPNITSLGVLNILTTNGNAFIGNNIFSVGAVSAIGNVYGANFITTGSLSATGSISGADMSLSGNIVVSGNATVSGNTTIINSQTLNIADKNIIVANNVSTSALIDGAGIDAGNPTVAYIRYSDSSKGWTTANNISVGGNLSVTGTSAITGVLTAPTAANSTSNTQVATTAFVRNILPTGVITMWSGSVATIPSGWYLCDGANGTPDLRDRFIVGAGSTYSVAGTGGSANATLVSHSHTATSVVTDPGHQHGYPGHLNGGGGNPGGDLNGLDDYGYKTYFANTGISVGTTISTEGSSATNANLPPYYALAYIMKS